jgi:hypothetical protein
MHSIRAQILRMMPDRFLKVSFFTPHQRIAWQVLQGLEPSFKQGMP